MRVASSSEPARATARYCELCEMPDRSLYQLTSTRRTGETRTSVLCRLCYVRQVGVEPHRAGRRPRPER